MKIVTVMQVRSRLTTLLDEVASGEEFTITRHGRVIARLVPERPRMAADAFKAFWGGADIDLEAPQDILAESTSGVGRDRLSPEDARKLLAGSMLRYADPLEPVADGEWDVRK